jgi:hypothetical protein
MPDPDIRAWPAKKIEVAEKYLDRMLAKLENAKTDIEKNWLAQITSIAISLALVAGLGTAIANKLIADPQRYNILYVVFPVLNTYFFVRFGLIAGVFSKARFNAECLVQELALRQDLPDGFDFSQIYKTNSYFEWAHHPFSRATFMFLFTIPIVFALNHSLTLYLIYKVLGLSIAFYVVVAFYLLIVAICYRAYYVSNKDNTVIFAEKGKNSFIILVIGTAALATVALGWALQRFDPDPRQIDLIAAPVAGAAAAAPTR